MSVGEMSTADVRNVKATAGSSTITFFRLHTKLCVQVNESGNHRRQCRLIRSPVSSQRIISTCHQVSRGPFFLRSDFRQVVCMTYTAAAGGGGHNFIRTGKAPSTPATMSKQHCRMLQVERFFRQCRMLLRQSRTWLGQCCLLLRHCCWCGPGLTCMSWSNALPCSSADAYKLVARFCAVLLGTTL